MRRLPLIFGIGLAMHHPFVKTIERDSSRCGVGEYGLRPPWTWPIENGIVSLKWRLTLGHDQQCRAMPTQPRHLQISRIFSDIRIVERALGVRLFQTGR